MNCTRVLHAIGSHPQPAMMPVDLSMCLSLSQRQSLYQLLSISPLKPTHRCCQLSDCPQRTSLRSSHHSLSPSYTLSSTLPSVPSGPRSCFRKDGAGLSKKRVVFADAKGLALTAVRLFTPEPSSPDSPLVVKLSPAKLQSHQLVPSKQQRYKLKLGFPQPVLDFKAFLARLRETHIQLESCSISEHSLTGKVCVSHVGTEKSVHIRMTFDSWQSHHDIPCTFLQQLPCGSTNIAVFTFDLSLPKNLDPKERVEFCVYFTPGPGATPQWDDNRGQNYRVCIEKDGANADQGDARHCYATLAHLQPPSWPSHVSLSMQKSAGLRYPQKSLSRVEWKTLCSTK
uniref:protein phosphatase 1 regulatory subunit 3C-B n=1 Tax=Scatophagus argus TaxID=75038 RepID=UPI001ED854A9|nr:protein phosphatase 1 regulatory subunit 3C-B [Scatophagus argus]